MTTIPMLQKELEQAYKDIKYYKNRIERLNNQLQQKEKIIKEVREYLEEHTTYERYGYIDELQLVDLDFSIKDLKQILDKENKE